MRGDTSTPLGRGKYSKLSDPLRVALQGAHCLRCGNQDKIKAVKTPFALHLECGSCKHIWIAAPKGGA